MLRLTQIRRARQQRDAPVGADVKALEEAEAESVVAFSQNMLSCANKSMPSRPFAAIAATRRCLRADISPAADPDRGGVG